MVKNLLKAQGARKAANVAYWTAMSEKIESRARVVVPLMYFLTLIVIFNLDMRDDYKDDPKATMFTGVAPNTTFDTHGVVLLIVVIVLSIAALGVYYTSSKAVTKSILRQEEKIKLASRKVAHAISEGGMEEVKRRPSATPTPTPWLNRVMRLSRDRRQDTLDDVPRPSPVQVKTRSRSKSRPESRLESRLESVASPRRESEANAILAAALSPSKSSGNTVLDAQHKYLATAERHVDSPVLSSQSSGNSVLDTQHKHLATAERHYANSLVSLKPLTSPDTRKARKSGASPDGRNSWA